MSRDSEGNQILVELSVEDTDRLIRYQERREAGKHFEIEELFDLLDGICMGLKLTTAEPDTEENQCTNYYACANCSCDWEIEATCGHDDRCPNCNTSMTPYFVKDYEDTWSREKEIQEAFDALEHRQSK